MVAARTVAAGAVFAAVLGAGALVVGMAVATPSDRPSGAAATDVADAVRASASLPVGTTPAATAPTAAGTTTAATPPPRSAPSVAHGTVTVPRSSDARGGTSDRSAAHDRTATSERRAAPGAGPRRSAPAVRTGQALPLAFGTGSATQVVTVVAASTGSITATVQAWDRAAGGGWIRHGAAVPAHVGSDGLTPSPSETRSATPIGSFTLSQAFGRAANPGTGLPYFVAGAADWWVSDVRSPLYNTHQRCAQCPFDTGASENLSAAGPVYDYAVVIDYNRFPARSGAGSAFFLHVTDGGATAGCVAIPRSSLVAIMRWLAPAAHPRILIGIA